MYFLKEYLEDYASEITKESSVEIIEKELMSIKSDKVRKLVLQHFKDIENGKRDFRF